MQLNPYIAGNPIRGALSLIETFSNGVAAGTVAPFLKLMGL